MAEPGSRQWNPTDVIRDGLPQRRLFAVAISNSLCLIFYEHRGFGKNYNVAVFRLSGLTPQAIWHASIDSNVKDPASLANAAEELAHGDTMFY